MQLIDNINKLLGDDLKGELRANAKLKVAASCFSIYAFEALRAELEKVDSFEFIFTAPTFVPAQATDSGARERREFHIPKVARERDFYGTDFEIQLKNKLTQRAIAKECADWIRRKGRFRSNCTKSPMDCCVADPLRQPSWLELRKAIGNVRAGVDDHRDDNRFQVAKELALSPSRLQLRFVLEQKTFRMWEISKIGQRMAMASL